MTGWQLTAGGLVLLPVAALVEGPPPGLSASNVAGLAYLSLVGCALAYTLWFHGIERLPAPSVSLLALLSPVVATLLGRVLLDQALSPLQLLGVSVALAAVLLGQPHAQSLREACAPPPPRVHTWRADSGPAQCPYIREGQWCSGLRSLNLGRSGSTTSLQLPG
jgi:probable blue pigment (indigoidine) exporter